MTPTSTYSVRDAAGTIVAIHERIDRPGGKHFLWRRPDGSPGLGGLSLTSLPLYGSETAKDWDPDSIIVVTEGEKARDAVRAAGFASVGTVTGASSTPGVASLRILQGRHVALWPDADDVGVAHMERVAYRLQGIAASVRLVAWAEAPPHGDAADAPEGLIPDLIDAAEPMTLPPEGPAVVPERHLAAVDAFTSEDVASAITAREPESGMVFNTTHGIYSAAWRGAFDVGIDFDLVRLERSGEVTAETTVRSILPGAERVIHRARFNLSSTRARSELAKYLGSVPSGRGLPWAELLGPAVLATVEAFRQGEPAILLRDAERPAFAGHVLPPLLVGGHWSVLFGDGGSGKSYLALAAALSLETGEPLLGIQPETRLRVAYLDWEFGAWDHRDRARQLLGHEDHDLVYVRCRAPLVEEADRLRRVIREQRIDYAIIDSAAYACSGAPEASDVTMAFFQAASRLELPAGGLIVAHVPKDRGTQTEKPFGSAFWFNSVRTAWYADAAGEQAPGTLSVALYNRKANTSQRHAPIAVRLVFGDDRVLIERPDPMSVPELAAKEPVWLKVRRAVSSGSLTIHEIAETIDQPVDTVTKAVNRGHGKVFTKVPGPDGIYRVGLLAPAS